MSASHTTPPHGVATSVGPAASTPPAVTVAGSLAAPVAAASPPVVAQMVHDVTATVTARLSGATVGAQGEFQAAVQAYAARLAQEAEAQEISNRPPGMMFPEITSNSVVRAKDVLNKFGIRSKPGRGEISAFVCAPLSFTVAGVFGSYLNAPMQWGGMLASGAVGLVSLGYLVKRRVM